MARRAIRTINASATRAGAATHAATLVPANRGRRTPPKLDRALLLPGPTAATAPTAPIATAPIATAAATAPIAVAAA